MLFLFQILLKCTKWTFILDCYLYFCEMSSITVSQIAVPTVVLVPKTPIEEALSGPGPKGVAVPTGTIQVGCGRVTGFGGRPEEAGIGAASGSASSAVSVGGGAVASVGGGHGVAAAAAAAAAAVVDVEEEEELDYEEDGSDVSTDESTDEMDTTVVDRQLYFDSQVVVAFHTLPHSSYPGLCLALVWHPSGHRAYVVIEDRARVESLKEGFGKVLRRRRPLFLLDDGVEAGALESWAGETREFMSWGRMSSPLSPSSSFENPAWPVFQLRSPWCPDSVVVAVRGKVVELQESVMSMVELREMVDAAVLEDERVFKGLMKAESRLGRSSKVSPFYWGCNGRGGSVGVADEGDQPVPPPVPEQQLQQQQQQQQSHQQQPPQELQQQQSHQQQPSQERQQSHPQQPLQQSHQQHPLQSQQQLLEQQRILLWQQQQQQHTEQQQLQQQQEQQQQHLQQHQQRPQQHPQQQHPPLLHPLQQPPQQHPPQHPSQQHPLQQPPQQHPLHPPQHPSQQHPMQRPQQLPPLQQQRGQQQHRQQPRPHQQQPRPHRQQPQPHRQQPQPHRQQRQPHRQQHQPHQQQQGGQRQQAPRANRMGQRQRQRILAKEEQQRQQRQQQRQQQRPSMSSSLPMLPAQSSVEQPQQQPSGGVSGLSSARQRDVSAASSGNRRSQVGDAFRNVNAAWVEEQEARLKYEAASKVLEGKRKAMWEASRSGKMGASSGRSRSPGGRSAEGPSGMGVEGEVRMLKKEMAEMKDLIKSTFSGSRDSSAASSQRRHEGAHMSRSGRR